MATKWIKCLERVPEERTCVIVFVDCSMIDKSKNNLTDYVGIGFWDNNGPNEQNWSVFYNPMYAYFGLIINKVVDGQVTHWMPLPKRPIRK